MPFEEVLDTETGPSEADKVQELLEKHAAKLREVKIVRSGRNGPLLQHWRHSGTTPDEDIGRAMHELAQLVVDAAERDAGSTMKRYVVHLLGEALPGRAKPELDKILIRAGDSDRAPKASDVVNTHARDIGDRHLRLLDVTLSQLEKIAPLQAAADERERVHSAADAQVKIHCADLDFRERQDARDKKADQELQVWLFEMAKMNRGLLLAFEGFINAKSKQILANLEKKAAPGRKKKAKKKAAKKTARKAGT